MGGSAFIVAIPTVFGTCAGLAFAARRRGWTSWRQYVPRALTVALFIPFGFGGGMPLMLTVLLVTLAVTWPALPRIVIAVLSLLILVAAAAAGSILISAVLLVTLAVTYVAWKLVALRASERGMEWMKLWLTRTVRASLLLLAAGTFVAVSVQIVTDKPGWLAPAYVAMYLVLLCPLFVGLLIGLQPAISPTQCKVESFLLKSSFTKADIMIPAQVLDTMNLTRKESN